MNFYPTYKEFRKKAAKGRVVPVFIEILADMETPVSIYKKISQQNPYSFLLESVEAGTVGRYSFIGCASRMIFRSKGRKVEIISGNKKNRFIAKTTPLGVLRDILDKTQYVKDPRLPSFCGGAVGYISYDYIRFIENIPDANPAPIDVYDTYFMFNDMTIIFDHVKRKIQIVLNVEAGPGGFAPAYEKGKRKILRVLSYIRNRKIKAHDIKPSASKGRLRSNFTKDDFRKVVKKCKQYIRRGDILQCVISQTFAKPISCKPFDIYRTLRTINPSPYMFYLDFNGFNLIGSSPEIMVKLDNDKAVVRPIAGTRPRGASDKEDERLIEDLLADEKERAEHVMLVDLGRNDLGRVCEPGSVKVTDLMSIEKYSHVLHIVSNVEGKLAKGNDAFDLFEATFPAGTVSGAPKIRAMEIIDELEPSRRGPYAGAVGYFSFSGDIDLCITIRTIVVKDGVAYVQAGAGIVADSKPEREYTETLNKAQAMLRAVELAENGVL